MEPTTTNEPVITVTEPAPAPPPAPDAALTQRVDRLERELREAQQSLRRAEARALIHRALAGAGAVDADAVALVIESALDPAAVPDAAGVARAVEEARRKRPGLFREPPPRRAPAMGARVERPPAPLADAALDAARSGDRTSLMRYLRLRRTA